MRQGKRPNDDPGEMAVALEDQWEGPKPAQRAHGWQPRLHQAMSVRGDAGGERCKRGDRYARPYRPSLGRPAGSGEGCERRHYGERDGFGAEPVDDEQHGPSGRRHPVCSSRPRPGEWDVQRDGFAIPREDPPRMSRTGEGRATSPQSGPARIEGRTRASYGETRSPRRGGGRAGRVRWREWSPVPTRRRSG